MPVDRDPITVSAQISCQPARTPGDDYNLDISAGLHYRFAVFLLSTCPLTNGGFQLMPYIKRERRGVFDDHLRACAAQIGNEGELNYCIYRLSALVLERIGESYANLAMCSSAMEHAKLEWYRRKVAPYEETKIHDNGDI
jgi:hypothetical protein